MPLNDMSSGTTSFMHEENFDESHKPCHSPNLKETIATRDNLFYNESVSVETNLINGSRTVNLNSHAMNPGRSKPAVYWFQDIFLDRVRLF